MAESYTGFLRTKGHDIVDEDGKKFYPIGFGVGGAIYPEGYMWQMFGGPVNEQKTCEGPSYMYAKLVELAGEEAAKNFWDAYRANWCSETDIASFAEWGANHIRLPLTYKTFMTPEGEWIEEGFAEIQKFVDWCKKYGLYVILDLHAAPGGQNPWHFCDALGEALLWTQPEQYWPLTITVWKEIARRYKDEPFVLGYDLLNEPLLPGGHGINELWEIQELITKAIREIDQNHIVFIEGDVYATIFRNVSVFDSNMAFSYHLYRYNGPNVTKADIQPYLDLRNRTNCPLWNGETGDHHAGWWNNDLELHKQFNIGIAMWTHKKIVTSNQPYVVELAAGFDKVIAFETGRGSKIDSKLAEDAMMRQAEAMKSENCLFQPLFLKGFGWIEKKN
ncbi:MAG: glycoside hydrolase family 5 protein [Clostridiales bacterium]|jgi:aryl-phospho-beta-D-glucosidase BglC (GH1 family)|nr:glycoside hydrolase family 5 protein [Clostridiales bacterium]